MTLFWTTFDGHAIMPWLIAGTLTAVGLWLAKRNAPELAATWHDANSVQGGRSSAAST